MSFLTNDTRRRIGIIGMCAMIIGLAWVLQLAVVSQIRLGIVQASLPLTITIVWGITFGSPVAAPTLDELRVSDFRAVLVRQMLSGSVSGALIGACFAGLYSSVLPVYPVCYPIIGYIAGYFCLRNFNQSLILCIPLVLIFTFLGEGITALHLAILGRPEVFEKFMEVVMSEGVLNALIAPFIFVPMRGWCEFAKYREMMG
ncbi:MAG: rod shape-determining protein MreD [Cyanobacteria bacterium]|nr:rod shape-determining protein MreD [Cyanobacteriota bacterium]